MSTDVLVDGVVEIGNAAGLVWQYLETNGPATLTKLSKELELSRDLLMQGVGWLAREGKIRFIEKSRSRLLALS